MDTFFSNLLSTANNTFKAYLDYGLKKSEIEYLKDNQQKSKYTQSLTGFNPVYLILGGVAIVVLISVLKK